MPTTMPATARPQPPWRVCLIWLSAITPRTIPTMAPMPQSRPTTDATNDAIANVLVPGSGAPYQPGRGRLGRRWRIGRVVLNPAGLNPAVLGSRIGLRRLLTVIRR